MDIQEVAFTARIETGGDLRHRITWLELNIDDFPEVKDIAVGVGIKNPVIIVSSAPMLNAFEIRADDNMVRVCANERCGVEFAPTNGKQRYCTYGCGCKARVQRHRERKRAIND